MRIHLLSDLHQEFGKTEIPQVDCDLIVLAGDISTKTNALEWIRELNSETPVVYVSGNHECYGTKWPRIIEKLQEQTQNSHIHVLENQAISINGWTIWGATLWTDMCLMGDWQIGCYVANSSMNDYKRIRNSAQGYRKLTANDTRLAHIQSISALENFLSQNNSQKSIIVTHHAPSILSVSPDRRKDTLAAAYASHLDNLISEYQPALWLHGHTHYSCDYWLGETRVISNPQAYPGDINPYFDPGFSINLEEPK